MNLLRFQVRWLHQLPKPDYGSEAQFLSQSLSKSYFIGLQANKTANQSQISKLASFYKNISPAQLSERGQLSNALYFSSFFCKSLPTNLLNAAEDHVKALEDDVLRVVAQKLLRLNQWHIAERLINKKFDGPEGENLKFEVFSLNGNYRKMVEQLPRMWSVPQNIQFQLICLLNSKDGKLPEIEDGIDLGPWGKLLNVALKGRLLSANPPTLMTFLRIIEILSHRIRIDSSVLILGLTKTTDIYFDAESIGLVKSVFSKMSSENLMSLANKLQDSRKEIPEELVSTLLEQICKQSIGTGERTASSLLGWIIKFSPDQYSYNLLIKEFGGLIDERIARKAIDAIGLSDQYTMQFIEFCLLERGLSLAQETIRKAVDISAEKFGYLPSEDLLRHIHQNGLVLSSVFYLKYLQKLLENNSSTGSCQGIGKLRRAFECFKLISSESLHGDFLQRYMNLSHELLDLSLKSSNLDWCFKIYKVISKYQLLKTLNRSKSFRDFIQECFKSEKVTGPFRPTNNLECIRAVMDCTHLDSSMFINEKFCVVALQAALTNLDFCVAQKLRVYMNNQGFNDTGLTFCQSVLQQWFRKLKQ